MYIKEKVAYKGNDIKLKISLSGNQNLNGLQQSINNFIEEKTGLSINPATDGETFRIKTNSPTKTFSFKFYDGFVFTTSLFNAGFTADEINLLSDVVKGSFYIMQIYDSKVSENQLLLHSGYLNGYEFVGDTSSYIINSNNEFSNLYIEENFLDSKTGSTTFFVYAKFLFFNAKTGKLQAFINEANESLTTEDRLYFQLEINKLTRKYSFISSQIACKELLNSQYLTKLNDTLNSFNDEKPTYPTGNKFNSDGTYEENV